jgi:molybdopterin-guanine dinucleotide biosynthesis protein A
MKLNAVSKVILQAEIAPKSPPVCCILAGGRGQRMGGKDKALIRLAGKTLLDHVASRLALQARTIVLNANGEPSRFAAFGLPVIADGISGHAGPLAGILAGLEWAAAEDASEMVSVAIDTPFLPRDLVKQLKSARCGHDIACAASGGRVHPVIGLWPTRLADDLRQALTTENLHKVDAWTARHRLAIAEWPIDAYDPFFNINRPQDLIEAERILSEPSPRCPR